MAQGKTTTAAAIDAPSEADIRTFLEEIGTGKDGNLIGVLQQVQDQFGYLPGPALQQISRRMRIPLSRVYGVVSFYAQFYTEPRGKHTVRCCTGTACHVKGAGRVLDAVKRELDIEQHQSTPDLVFYLETVACLGTCFLAPVMMVDDEYYGNLTQSQVGSILRNYREKA